MFYLLLAILCSSIISIIMRLSTDRVKNNIGMLVVNYIVCACLAGVFAGELFPESSSLGQTLGLGAVNGVLYLGAFVLMQVAIKQSGVVLPSVFMKLGLLVPMVLSVFLFGEMPTAVQIIGFVIAVIAIILINLEKDKNGSKSSFKFGLILLLLVGGMADAMSKVFEEVGDSTLSSQFLFYTFVSALILCLCLMLYKKQRVGKNELLFGVLIGVPNFFSSKFLLRSLASVDAVIAYPTFSVATILVVTLAGVLFFKERLGKRQWAALGIILAALVLLNI